MRVYLASRFGRRKEMRKYATDLGNLGHSVTSGWVFEEAHDGLDATLGKGTHDDFWQQIGEDDALDILGSDMLIQFTDGVRSPGGKDFELGYAYRLDLDIMVVGPRVHPFHYLPGVEVFNDWQEALEAIQKDTVGGGE